MMFRPSDTRFYLASQFGRAREMDSYARIFREWGYTITSEWHIAGKPQQVNYPEGSLEAIEQNLIIARADLHGITTCSHFLTFSEDMRNLPQGATRGGRHAEFGIAVGLGKTIILVGPREHVFHYLPGVIYFPTPSELFKTLAYNSVDMESPS